MTPKAPGYAAAMAVKHALEEHGYTVRCVLRSKMENLFDVEEGAAQFRTDAGDFEALFLRNPYTFDPLQIDEERKDNRFLYHLSGKPYFETRMDAAYELYFTKRSKMLIIAYSRNIAAALDAFL